MSFSINWQAFARQSDFQTHIRELLTAALNKSKPHILEDRIEVLNLDWGTSAPSLELLEVGDIAADRFRGVFKLSYSGEAMITVSTKVQANLLNVYTKSSPSAFCAPKFVAATSPLPIPLNLTLRNIVLQGTVIVVFSKSRGLTLVFRNDPLKSIEVSSTFDTVPIIASFLQQQIETQIRTLFRDEVPSVLYKLSLKYLPSAADLVQAQASWANTTTGAVKFADIDVHKPVSVVNVLHIEAMMHSRRTLALDTPVMPTAIVRSQLGTLLSNNAEKSQNLNIEGGSGVYKQLYQQSRHPGKHKRRVIKIKRTKHEVLSTDSTPQLSDSEESIELKYEPKSEPIQVNSPAPGRLDSCIGTNTARHLRFQGSKCDLKIPHLFSYFPNYKMLEPSMWLPIQEADELPPSYEATYDAAYGSL